MKKEDIKHLLDKYKNGKTSLKEERQLAEHSGLLDSSDAKLFYFIKQNKVKIDDDLNDKIWQGFEDNKTALSYKILKPILAIAASLMLIVSIWIGYNSSNEMSYSEKQAMIEEAQKLIENAKPSQYQEYIIYEDDLVVIYTTN